ncbi:MAG: hypothetical protein EG823_04150 [Actinobacteria bacterium]|nr:hypothetical protein [Actinomycetota bacterium]
MCRRVGEELERRHAGDPMGLVMAKGELARQTGFLAGLVARSDPDDPEKIKQLRKAAAGIGIYV